MAVDLGEFEGKPVTEVAIEVRGVNGGLNKAVKIDPVVLMQGQRGVVMIEFDATQIRHEPVTADEPDGPQRRVQILKAEGAVIAEGKLVDDAHDAISNMQFEIQKAEAAASADADRAKQAKKDRVPPGQQSIDDTGVGTEPVSGTVTDEVAAARADKVKKSTTATKAAGRQVNPNPKKAPGAKKAPPKKRPRTH